VVGAGSVIPHVIPDLYQLPGNYQYSHAASNAVRGPIGIHVHTYLGQSRLYYESTINLRHICYT